MFKWLKKHFIPHEGNNHRPHFLHTKNASQLMGIVLIFELVLFVLPALNFTGFINSLNLGAVLPGVLSTLTNEKRTEINLPSLKESEVLNKIAKLKAEDMASKSYFAHTSPEGLSPWYWFKLVGYNYDYAGENLAVNFVDSEDVTEAWMNSPTHKANIVKGIYSEVGTGVATGMYKGKEAIFVAQVYAHPQVIPAVIAEIPIEPVIASIPPAETVLGEAQAPLASKASDQWMKQIFKKAASSPRHTTDAVLYTIMSIVTLALLFNIFVKIKHHHPDLILNGAMVMVVILGLHLGNSYISESKKMNTSFVAFDSLSQVQNQE